MNSNLNSPLPSPRGFLGEGWAAAAGVLGSALLLAKKLLSGKAKPEAISRSEFYAETMATRDRLNAAHLVLLEKLEGNHREILVALERQAGRIGAVELALARLEERLRKNADCGLRNEPKAHSPEVRSAES